MKIYFKLLCLLSVCSFYGQEDVKLNNNLLKINIITPGFSFEKSISSKNSINLDCNISLGYSSQSNSNSNFVAAPFLRSQFRHYYNLKKRNSKGKSITGNSGNYIAPTATYYFKPFNNPDLISISDELTLGATWGLQRTYRSGININLNTGLGYNFSKNQSATVIPIINFTLGWVIFKN